MPAPPGRPFNGPLALRFSLLGSGSAGNSALLRTDNTRVLIDAGFSAKRLAGLLAAHGERLEANIPNYFEMYPAKQKIEENGKPVTKIDGMLSKVALG